MMQFSKQQMQDMLWGDDPEFTIIKDSIYGTGRWTIEHEVIFTHKEKLYRTYYSKGATENQDERPFEYENDPMEVDEVIRVPIQSHIYIKKTELNTGMHVELTKENNV